MLLEWEQRVADGAPDDFEALCTAHPELALALRRLHQSVSPSTPADAPRPPAESTSATELEPDTLAQLLSAAGSARVRAQRYRRVAELGRGAMGVVFDVWDRELARSLAMKVLASNPRMGPQPGAQAQRLQRFLREVRTMARLDHPGIVPVHEFGLDGEGRPFFTMKRVQGRELKSVFADVWRGDPQWSLARAVGALLKVCEAVDYAHSKGVVHRDLKPANVMVGPFGEVLVMDWGVAHVLDGLQDAENSGGAAPAPTAEAQEQHLTEDGDVLGTAVYMAPEQARGERSAIGPSIDVYALGAMLYHLLARHAPYAEKGASMATTAVITRLMSGPPLALAQAAPDAPSELVSICEKAMARDLAQRYSGMSALAEDLRAWLEGRVVSAHDAGAWAQLRKWVARNKALSLSSAAAVVTLLAGLGGVARMQALRADDALDAGERIRVERDNATAAAERARVEAATSERTLGFFEAMFAELEPSRRVGEELTVRRFLDQAAERIDRELLDEPQIRTRLLAAIGTAYGGVGAAARALEVFDEALEASAQAHGPRSQATVNLRTHVAALLIATGDAQGARAALERVAQDYAELGLAESEAACENQRQLALTDALLGDAPRALARLDELIARSAGEAGGQPRLRVSWERDRLELLHRLGRSTEAIERAHELIARLSASPDELLALSRLERWLAGVLEERNELAASEPVRRAALARLQRAQPLPLAELAAANSELGRLLVALSRAQQGEQFVVPPESRERCEEGLRLMQRGLEQYDQIYDVDRRAQVALASEIGMVLFELGDAPAARPYLERAVGAHRAGGGEFDRAWSSSLKFLAQVYIELGEWELAEPVARERLERAAPDDPLLPNRRALLDRIQSELARVREQR